MGRIDSLVNSAGGQFPQPAIDFSVKGWNTVINTNLNGTWYMMQAAAQRWRDRKHPGSIVNIVVVTTHGLYGIAHRVAARAGVIGLSRSVAVEWAPLNIRVNCVAPGAIETEGWNVYTPEARAAYPRSNPMMRAGSPWDIAEACVYLAGPFGTLRHRRDADGRRRRAVVGRDLDHGEAGIFCRWRWVKTPLLQRNKQPATTKKKFQRPDEKDCIHDSQGTTDRKQWGFGADDRTPDPAAARRRIAAEDLRHQPQLS